MGSFLGLFSEDGVNMLYHAQLILVVRFNFPVILSLLLSQDHLVALTDHGVSINVPCELQKTKQPLQTSTNNLDELF